MIINATPTENPQGLWVERTAETLGPFRSSGVEVKTGATEFIVAKLQSTEKLTFKFKHDTTTSPLGVMIGTFSHMMPLSTSITSPAEDKSKERKED